MYKIELLDTTHTEQLKIKLTPEIKDKTWEQVAHITNPLTRQRSYYNLLVRETFLSWLTLMLEIDLVDDYPLINNFSIWEFINGNAIAIKEHKLILIPTDSEDKSEISIAEEWFTIPDWIGNYYIPVTVNLEDNYLDFWGYFSSQKIINNSELDNINYHRDIEAQYLESDLSLLCLEYQYDWETVPQIQPLSSLSSGYQQQLVERIKNELFPRYSLDFQEWLTIINNEQTRNYLYEARQPISLTQWLNQQIEATITKGWQKTQNLIADLLAPDLSLQASFSSRRASISLTEALDIIRQNQQSDRETLNYTLSIIPDLIKDNSPEDIIEVLVDLLNSNQDEEIRWSTALCLEKISPHHPMCPCWYSKNIVIPCLSDDHQLGLLIAVLPKKKNELSLFVRIYPATNNQHNYLPENLQLQIIDENDNVYQTITSSKYDSIIQYKFWGSQGEKFQLQVRLEQYVNVEQFII